MLALLSEVRLRHGRLLGQVHSISSAGLGDPALLSSEANARYLRHQRHGGGNLCHPFEDGHGRLTRVLTDTGSWRRRGGLDVTLWLRWFLGCLNQAIMDEEEALQTILAKGQL